MRNISLSFIGAIALVSSVLLFSSGAIAGTDESRNPSVETWTNCDFQPQGNATTANSFDLSKINCNNSTVSFPGTTPNDRYPVSAFGRCRYISNATNNAFFVPLNSEAEWLAFIDNAVKIEGISLESCKICSKTSQNVVYVVDQSGSIGTGNFNNKVRPFFGNLVDAIHEEINTETSSVNNNSSLVKFSWYATDVTTQETDDSTFSNVVRTMSYDNGDTCISCGLNSAISILDNITTNSNQKTIVLFTDGQNNTPSTPSLYSDYEQKYAVYYYAYYAYQDAKTAYNKNPTADNKAARDAAYAAYVAAYNAVDAAYDALIAKYGSDSAAYNAGYKEAAADLTAAAKEIKAKGYKLIVFGVSGYNRSQLESLLKNAGMSSATNAALDEDGNQILFTSEDFDHMDNVTKSMVKTICVTED